jgi:nucleotide-binding universal stress UspA family protein
MGRVVVGVDGSRASMAALRWAVEEARLRGAVLETVHVFENTPVWRLSVHPQERDEPVEHFSDVEVDAVMVEDRHPERVLVERAQGADMLVVGSRGLGDVSQMLLGSVSHHCAVHAPCPLVIIHTPPSDDPPPTS